MTNKRATNGYQGPPSPQFAGGKRRYNRLRALAAEFRRSKLVRLMATMDISRRGWQTELANTLGVSRSTVSRDIDAIGLRQRKFRENRARERSAEAEYWSELLSQALDPSHPRWQVRKQRQRQRQAWGLDPWA